MKIEKKMTKFMLISWNCLSAGSAIFLCQLSVWKHLPEKWTSMI